VQRFSKFLVASVVALSLVRCARAQKEVTADKGTNSRILKLEELSFIDIDRLDRKKTIFFLTFGNLEEHGPHLPVGSDYFMAVGLRDALISRLHAQHPDYNFVVFPVIPIGECGANDLVGQFEHIGTYNVRFQTLREVAVDLGASIARKKFQNILVLHYHGCLLHNMAFNDAAAFVSEQYHVRMVHVTGLLFAEEEPFNTHVIEKHLGKGWEERIGWDAHAGAAETSINLYLREDLVKSGYKQLPVYSVKDAIDARQAFRERPEWRGYWGAPAKATKEMGKDLMEDITSRAFRLVERALAGEDLSRLPIYPQNLLSMPGVEAELREHLQIYSAQAAEVDAWMAKNGSEHKIPQSQPDPKVR
jgi:creatinine amidohydrolase